MVSRGFEAGLERHLRAAKMGEAGIKESRRKGCGEAARHGLSGCTGHQRIVRPDVFQSCRVDKQRVGCDALPTSTRRAV